MVMPKHTNGPAEQEPTDLMDKLLRRSLEVPNLDVEAINNLIHSLNELVNIGIAHAQLDLVRAKRSMKKDRIEAILCRAFPGGTAELKGPIRELVDLLAEE
jgi:hypothetical protein